MPNDQQVYLVSSFAVHSVDASAGSANWSYQSEGYIQLRRLGALPQSEVRANGPIYFLEHTDDGDYLVSLDGVTGDVIWRNKYSRGDLTVDLYLLFANGGDLYFSGCSAVAYRDCGFERLDVQTGEIIWRHQTFDEFSSGIGLPLHIILADGVLYVVSKYPHLNSLYALSASDGTLKWHSTEPGILADHSFHSLRISNEYLAVAWNGGTGILDAATGKLKHQMESPFWNGVVHLGTAYSAYGDCDIASVYASDISMGALLWQFNTGTGQINGNLRCCPREAVITVAEGILYGFSRSCGGDPPKLFALHASP